MRIVNVLNAVFTQFFIMFLGCGRYMTFWITDNLGTCALSELTEEGAVVFDVRDIADGKNNTPDHPFDKVVYKLNTLVHVYYENTIDNFKLVVRCAAGVSRSNAFAAGLIAYNKNISFEDALNEVKAKVPRAYPNPDICDDIKEALRILRESPSKRLKDYLE